jgi:hypothetical protein
LNISFVMTTRNDGYGGEVNDKRNFIADRLNLTCNSIRALAVEKNINAEIIVVEYAPPADRPRLKELITGVRIITVGTKLDDLLKEDHLDFRIPFYEYVGKDIGIKKARHEYIVVCNPDNILPGFGWHHVENDLKHGMSRGYRLEIDRGNIGESPEILIRKANERLLPFFMISICAAGDFVAFHKDIYTQVGGYDMLHGGWGIDCAIVHKVAAMGIYVGMQYFHYHVNHDNSIGEGRYPILQYSGYKPISRHIVEKFDDFIEEDIYVA